MSFPIPKGVALMTSKADSTWAFMRGYYYRHPSNLWEERSEDPVKDMMAYVSKKEYFHFFCMGVTVEDNGDYRIHRMLSKAVYNFLRDDIK